MQFPDLLTVLLADYRKSGSNKPDSAEAFVEWARQRLANNPPVRADRGPDGLLHVVYADGRAYPLSSAESQSKGFVDPNYFVPIYP